MDTGLTDVTTASAEEVREIVRVLEKRDPGLITTEAALTRWRTRCATILSTQGLRLDDKCRVTKDTAAPARPSMAELITQAKAKPKTAPAPPPVPIVAPATTEAPPAADPVADSPYPEGTVIRVTMLSKLKPPVFRGPRAELWGLVQDGMLLDDWYDKSDTLQHISEDRRYSFLDFLIDYRYITLDK